MDDPRCCGTGTCIINAEGYCWCGQRWDGSRMCFPLPSDQPASGQPSPGESPAERLRESSNPDTATDHRP